MKLPTGFVRQNHFLTVKSVRNFDTSNLIVPPLCVLRRINQFLHPGVLRSCRPVCVDLAVRSASASLSLPRNFQPKTRNKASKKLKNMDSEGDIGKESLLLITQGAEARVFESTFVGRRSIVKERFSKKYRHPILDVKLTLKRLNAEARCMTKARKLGVCTPVLYAVDPLLHSLTLEYIQGVSVKDVFLEFGANGMIVEEEQRLDDIAAQIGEAIAKLHDGGLSHGDLTTSNMLLRSGTNQLVLIDFGLSFTSSLPEDKAVDLYVLERALLSMHSSCGNVMDRILTAYRKSSKQWSATFNKLAQVRQRGRKRTMIG
ncbi:uncharacterized protein LOC108838930 isoform X2 [Raphanus sativus]|uniref:non-specific serine/threonine protein kinase n=1 Tax=Raphanus sativus TaxID=3726 RepID=A0A9W3DPK3_RAPSA|nr:uncharacterized protein LOC108838930 isoform X2 [Raphanus sativus]